MHVEGSIDAESRHKQGNPINRRKFLSYAAGTGAGLVALAAGGKHVAHMLAAAPSSEPRLPGLPNDRSRVVIARSSDLFAANGSLQEAEVAATLDAGMKTLFGVEDAMQAWRALFTPKDVVGIKVNCIAGPNLSTRPQVVAAIVSELQKVPISAENIIIWDRTNRELAAVGYKINADGAGAKCYGTDALGYEEKAAVHRSFNGRLSKILTREITALINVPILKDHGGAGVSIAMKNHYGSFHNPGSHHAKGCDPSIADLNSLEDIKAKTKLVVCDATRAGCNGGPGYNPAFAWQYSGLLLSCDPVALDTIGIRIIDERRIEVGLRPLAEIGRYPRWLASAADRGLGNADANRIDAPTVNV
ncbi:MAG: DUF362 domain-containing protein [Candidatus Abyssobacteria bacterium SURF_17]|jgi:uncharacterized protein (DUF362 family)|uniref:DUF362 domain-containing protein n=1 Tax=Candidatus Abyssobacteria bacterium SURF_17 TaxID=2093361 RepID=A0A419EQG7_9BACT|nr:MAG: DUF362 domain-containing protein [Candidatus Abyssubacteria bacterium SURF_17]